MQEIITADPTSVLETEVVFAVKRHFENWVSSEKYAVFPSFSAFTWYATVYTGRFERVHKRVKQYGQDFKLFSVKKLKGVQQDFERLKFSVENKLKTA